MVNNTNKSENYNVLFRVKLVLINQIKYLR